MESKIKHLELIQVVINRMGNNSFLLKGWSVILVSALFALSAKDANTNFIYLAYFPSIAYWFLDGFYLWQERLYRSLYDKVRNSSGVIDFSMDTSVVKKETPSWLATTISKTLIIFHVTILLTITIIMILTR